MLKFELPPLRRRMADIDELVHAFVRRFSAKHGITIRGIEPALFETLTHYAWPGNVRELENVIQRAVIYARDGVLSPAQLPSHIAASAVATAQHEAASAQPMPVDVADATLEVRMAHTERDLIEQALKRNNFSRTRTARELGVSRVTLYNKMKKFGMSG
jgi:DNA-binding NtrC family response regulator